MKQVVTTIRAYLNWKQSHGYWDLFLTMWSATGTGLLRMPRFEFRWWHYYEHEKMPDEEMLKSKFIPTLEQIELPEGFAWAEYRSPRIIAGIRDCRPFRVVCGGFRDSNGEMDFVDFAIHFIRELGNKSLVHLGHPSRIISVSREINYGSDQTGWRTEGEVLTQKYLR